MTIGGVKRGPRPPVSGAQDVRYQKHREEQGDTGSSFNPEPCCVKLLGEGGMGTLLGVTVGKDAVTIDRETEKKLHSSFMSKTSKEKEPLLETIGKHLRSRKHNDQSRDFWFRILKQKAEDGAPKPPGVQDGLDNARKAVVELNPQAGPAAPAAGEKPALPSFKIGGLGGYRG